MEAQDDAISGGGDLSCRHGTHNSQEPITGLADVLLYTLHGPATSTAPFTHHMFRIHFNIILFGMASAYQLVCSSLVPK
jgi:hypothetical protein